MDGKYLVENLKDLETFKNIIKDQILENKYNNFFEINNDKFIEYLEKYKNSRSIIDTSKISTDIFNEFTSRDKPIIKENIYKYSNYHTKFESKSNDIKDLIKFILTTHLNYNEELDENQIQYIYLMLAPSKSIGTGNITSNTRNSEYFRLSDIFNFIYGGKIEWFRKGTNFGMKIIENTNKFNFMFLNFNKPIKEQLPKPNKEMGFIFPINNDELIESIINATLLFEFIELTVDYIKDEDSTLFDLNNQKTYIVKNDSEIFNFIERGINFNYLIDFDANRNKGEKKNIKQNAQLNLIKKPENDKINNFICLANDHNIQQTRNLYKNLCYHPNILYYNYPETKDDDDYDLKWFLKLKKTNNKLYSSYNLNTKSLENIYNQEKISSSGDVSYSKNRNDIQQLMKESDIICLQEANKKDFEFHKLTESVNSVNKPIKIKVVIDNDFKKGLKSKNIKEFLRTNNIEYLDKKFFINIYTSKKYTENGLFSDKNLIYVSNRLASYQDNDGTNKNSIKKFNITLFSNKIKLKDNDIYIGKIGNGWDYTHTHTFTAIKLNNDECIINIHLDTDDSKRIKQTELKILFNKIISRNKFFDKIKKIIVTGDFNMDTVDIIDILYSQIKSSFYINKKFRILLNNIVTGNKTALDNCIIIEENNENNKCDPPVIFEPDIYVTANKYHVNVDSIIMYKNKSNTKIIVNDESIKNEKEKLSDHSLISYYIHTDDSPQILKKKKKKIKKLKK